MAEEVLREAPHMLCKVLQKLRILSLLQYSTVAER
jgi:hypothetical protein